MLPVERHNKIINLLRERTTATTEEIAAMLGVSEMTVRRDLEICQNMGLLRRCHGGATISRQTVSEIAYDQKLNTGMQAKRALAKLAAKLVKPNMTVYLDAGTTTFCIAEELAAMDLTIITNDLKIAMRLLDSSAEIVVLGGTVQKRTGSMLGGDTVDQLRRLRASIAFVGAASIDDRLFTLTPTQEKVALKREINAMADKCYLVTDAVKFQGTALHEINHISQFDGIITDALLTAREKRLLGKKTRLITLEPSADQPQERSETDAPMHRDRG